MSDIGIPHDDHQLLLTAIITIGMQLAFFSYATTFKTDKVTGEGRGRSFTKTCRRKTAA